MSVVKISFLGDIMCEPRLLKASRTSDGQYDFSGVFRNVRDLLGKSDYVIGNLETPLAGVKAGYVRSLLRFNAPDSFAIAAKDAGVDLLLTANNHCLDRGLEGLKRTVQVLEENHISHAGTFLESGARDNSYFQIGDTRFAVISYTYGTNFSDNHILLSEEERNHVNLLRPQTEPYYIIRPIKRSVYERILYKIANSFRGDTKFYARKVFGVPVNQAHADDNLQLDSLSAYLDRLYADIDEAKREADIVLFCPHVGGQFNSEPGAFSEFIFQTAIERGVNTIVASHAHVVQKAVIAAGVPCFYSLGNFSMSPNSVYLIHDDLPDFGIIAHLYFSDEGFDKASFSIVKMIENNQITVWPIDSYVHTRDLSSRETDLLKQKVRKIYHTVTGRELCGDCFRTEYQLL